MDIAAVIIAVSALLFTVGSFWWLHARTGRIEATEPRAFAFVGTRGNVRVRLPLAFHNTGAVALIVSDLRLALEGDESRSHFDWTTTRDRLRPEKEDQFRFPTPFAVQGRGVREVIVEFGDEAGWTPEPDSRHRMRVQALIHPSSEWDDLVAFDWWAPVTREYMFQYLTHRNVPPSADAQSVPGDS